MGWPQGWRPCLSPPPPPGAQARAQEGGLSGALPGQGMGLPSPQRGLEECRAGSGGRLGSSWPSWQGGLEGSPASLLAGQREGRRGLVWGGGDEARLWQGRVGEVPRQPASLHNAAPRRDSRGRGRRRGGERRGAKGSDFLGAPPRCVSASSRVCQPGTHLLIECLS